MDMEAHLLSRFILENFRSQVNFCGLERAKFRTISSRYNTIRAAVGKTARYFPRKARYLYHAARTRDPKLTA